MNKVIKYALPTLFMAIMSQNVYAIDIKQDQINSCITNTLGAKIADATNAKKLCTCTVTIRSNMTIGEMWEIESYAQSGKDPSVLPYVKVMQGQLNQCTKDLVLQVPQM